MVTDVTKINPNKFGDYGITGIKFITKGQKCPKGYVHHNVNLNMAYNTPFSNDPSESEVTMCVGKGFSQSGIIDVSTVKDDETCEHCNCDFCGDKTRICEDGWIKNPSNLNYNAYQKMTGLIPKDAPPLYLCQRYGTNKPKLKDLYVSVNNSNPPDHNYIPVEGYPPNYGIQSAAPLEFFKNPGDWKTFILDNPYNLLVKETREWIKDNDIEAAEVVPQACKLLAMKGHYIPFCVDFCKEHDGKCDPFMKDYCNKFPSAPECVCVTSGKKIGANKYNPACVLPSCKDHGYKTKTMLASAEDGCQIIDCKQYLRLKRENPEIRIHNADLEQECASERIRMLNEPSYWEKNKVWILIVTCLVIFIISTVTFVWVFRKLFQL